MATAYQAEAAKDSRPATTTDNAGSPCVNRGVYTVAAAIVISDTFDMCKLPANHVPVDLVVSMTDLDTGTALVWDAGIYDAVGATDDDNCFIDSSTVGQAAGVARMDEIAGLTLAPAAYDRTVRITVDTAPGTSATSGEIIAVLTSRPKDYDD